jgi:hypothetical protein
MKKNLKILNLILMVSIIQFYACSNDNNRKKGSRTNQQLANNGNCSDAKEFAKRQYIKNADDAINLTIVGCEQNPDGSFTVEFTNSGTSENPGIPVKQNVRVGFDGNKYY